MDARLVLWSLTMTVGVFPVWAAAQSIRTDGSVGPAQTLAGPNYLIPQSLGKQAGGNLFHSFQTFNIAPGESATFTTSSAGIENVISRVTGGSPSILNGRLSLSAAEGGKPAFYFINPAGVVFGAGAAIDVPGAFHAGTADYVKFPDGAFHADLSRTSTFSVAAPEAFGFLGGPPAALGVKDGATLAAAPGQAISLVAGDITIGNGKVSGQGGEIRVFAVGQARADVPLAGATGGLFDGELTMFHGGQVALSPAASGESGSIQVAAGSLDIDGGGARRFTGISTRSNPGASGNAGNISIAVRGEMSLVDGGVVISDTFAAGSAGSIRVQAGSLAIDGRGSGHFTGINSQADAGSTGNAGSLDVAVGGELSLVNGGAISSNTFASGAAGSIAIQAASLHIDGQGNRDTMIASQAKASSEGTAGQVSVVVAGQFSIADFGSVASNAYGSGAAGAVQIQAGSLSIDGKGDKIGLTGIFSNAAGSAADSGKVGIRVAGPISIVDGGAIYSDSLGPGAAGALQVEAASLVIDGHGNTGTGVFSYGFGSSGNAGDLSFAVAGDMAVLNGGAISNSTYGSGAAGAIRIQAGDLSVANGATITSYTYASGSAGAVCIAVGGGLEIADQGMIASISNGSGSAGAVQVSAGSLGIDGAFKNRYTGIFSLAGDSAASAGAVDVDVAGALSIANSGTIGSDNSGSGPAGTVKVEAASLSISNGGSIASTTLGAGSAAAIAVHAGSLAIDGQGNSGLTGIYSETGPASSGRGGDLSIIVAGDLSAIDHGFMSSDTSGRGNAGMVQIQAGSLTLAKGGIVTSNTYASGTAGQVRIAADTLSMSDGAEISSNTWSSGDAGAVLIQAGNLSIDGRGRDSTVISSQALAGSTGKAGDISIVVGGALSLLNGGAIVSDTSGSGQAGALQVEAESLTIDGQGYAGLTGISSRAQPGSTGRANDLSVVVGKRLSVLDGGEMTSSTAGAGQGGTVQVRAGELEIDGQAYSGFTGISTQAGAGSKGDGGDIDIAVAGQLSLASSGAISASTFGLGNAGDIRIEAGSLSIDRKGAEALTGISSQANAGSLGSAGDIGILVRGAATLANGGTISSSTFAAGAAGNVEVQAASLAIDHASIQAVAKPGSSGQTGQVTVSADDSISLVNGGMVSIENQASVADPAAVRSGRLALSATDISLADGGRITSSASGNIAASPIDIHFLGSLQLASASISTSANLGDGGSIAIHGGQFLRLQDSQITTSVAGLAGNGGDIALTAANLILETGFIQANTAARPGEGGDIRIDVGNLLPSGNSLLLGDLAPYRFAPGVFAFNVVQAAAPDGVSGTIEVSVPRLDLAGKLGQLTVQRVETGGLLNSACQSRGDSSLAEVGRGAWPLAARDFIRIESLVLSPSSISSPLTVAEPVRLAIAQGCSR